jgi:CRP-like cAMP-binding protein
VAPHHQAGPNRFLASLPKDACDWLRPYLEPVDLPLRKILYEAGQPIEHVYFPGSGMISLVIRLEDGAAVEAGVVGREGLIGISGVLGTEAVAAHMAIVQMPARGVRIEGRLLRELMLRNPDVLDRILRFSEALNLQVSQTAACNAHHTLEARLARWLLMAHDRADGDVLPLTQEFTSLMLAVRRSGVNATARSLQAAGLITYSRGHITVTDRSGLEAVSCECYRVVAERYRRMLG